MKKKKNSALKKYAIEALLIVFSVLLALFLSNTYEAYQRNEQRKVAIESIRMELERNASLLESLRKRHIEFSQRLDSIIDGKHDSLKNALMSQNFFNLDIVTNGRSLMDDMITNTAWETAKSTGIISEFDYEQVQTLTQVYELQRLVIDGSLLGIFDLFFSLEAHDKANIEPVLIQFSLRFHELVAQERRLIDLYGGAINSVR